MKLSKSGAYFVRERCEAGGREPYPGKADDFSRLDQLLKGVAKFLRGMAKSLA